jgi:RNA polymerase sigma-70 factor (sigma-E family)
MVPATGELPEVAPISTRDLTAFADLFDEQRVPALRLAYAMTGDAGLAEDVVAEAFARTYERWSKGGIENPAAYVRRAVVNEVRSTFRRLAVRRRYAARQRSAEPSATFPGDRLADADVLGRALMTLTERQRAVVVLRVVDDLSEREVATVLRCSEGTVKSHLSRGLAQLRAALEVSHGGSHA